MIETLVSKNTVVIRWDDHSGDVGFVGYRIERNVMGSGDWDPWNGASWGEPPSVLTVNYLNDFDLPSGAYQYRMVLILATEQDPEYSDWAIVAIDKVGWAFENYQPPTGQFGEVLTADDMRFYYLFGIDAVASNSQYFSDANFRLLIKSAVEYMERELNIDITKRKILCNPSDDLTEGVDYDVFEDPYDYRPEFWRGIGALMLRRAPVISIQRAEFRIITDVKVIDLMTWLRIDHKKGQLNFYPRTETTGFIVSGPFTALAMNAGMRKYPHAFQIDYTSGYKHAGLVPNDLRDAIGKVASCTALNAIGDGLIAGFSSSSLSLDGVSESFSSTQSATSAYFGARIKAYQDEIKMYISRNRRKFGRMTMGIL